MKEKAKRFCDLKAGDIVYYVSPYSTEFVIEELELATDFVCNNILNTMRATSMSGKWININSSSWKKTVCKSESFYSTIEDAAKALSDKLLKEIDHKEKDIERYQKQVTRYVKEKGDLLKILTSVESKNFPVKRVNY